MNLRYPDRFSGTLARLAALTCFAASLVLLVSCAPRPPARRGPQQPPMVVIPGGQYVIGSDTGDENERPAHSVRVESFSIDEHEVTNEMYREFIRDTGYPPPLRWKPDGTYWPEDAKLPVTWVSWYDAQAYAAWRGCRLPTEAEWEAAARCTSAVSYPWGNEATLPSGRIPANVDGNDDGYRSGPAPVGSFPAGRSCWGVHDMAGNVWEWVADWYLPAAYQDSTLRATAVAVSDSLFGQRVIRGGSWFDPVGYARATCRTGFHPDYKSDIVGFRCARDTR